MTIALYFAAFLLFAIGVTHSVLGERYILIRLFRRDDLPKILGSAEFTKRTLRFAWHITTIAWWGIAAILVQIAAGALSPKGVALAIGITFCVSGLVSLIGSRARHYSWVVFLLVGGIAIWFAVAN